MPTAAPIKKGGGIDEILKGQTPGKLDVEKEPAVARREEFETLLLKYELALELDISPREKYLREMKKTVGVLTPEEIDLFLQTTVRYENHEKYCSSTGYFISRLIQDSYDAGHNDFTLNTKGLRGLDKLCTELKGKKKNPLKVTINGNAGNCCGEDSKRSLFYIEGNAGDDCGRVSKKSVFCVSGDVGSKCGSWSKKSTFKTPNRETLGKMYKDIDDSKYGGRVVFIKPDGTEEEVLNFTKLEYYIDIT